MREMIGEVIGTKMPKTATVKVERLWRHPIYRKTVKRTKKYLTHDELGVQPGDRVRIRESRPRSRRKRWIIVETISQPVKTAAKEKTKPGKKRDKR